MSVEKRGSLALLILTPLQVSRVVFNIDGVVFGFGVAGFAVARSVLLRVQTVAFIILKFHEVKHNGPAGRQPE